MGLSDRADHGNFYRPDANIPWADHLKHYSDDKCGCGQCPPGCLWRQRYSEVQRQSHAAQRSGIQQKYADTVGNAHGHTGSRQTKKGNHYTYKVTDTDSGSNRPNDTDTIGFTIRVNAQDCSSGARCSTIPTLEATENITRASFTDTSIAISWSPVSNASHYQLQWRENGGSWNSKNSETTDMSTKTIQTIWDGSAYQHLTPDTRYDFKVSPRLCATCSLGPKKLATFKTDKEFVITITAKENVIVPAGTGPPERFKTYTFSQSSPPWDMLAPYHLDIRIRKKYGGGDISKDNDFKVILDPAATGLEFTPKGACDWTADDTETDWFDFVNDKKVYLIPDLKVVRCDKGKTTNTGITVKSRRGSRVSTYHVASDMNQAWHRTGTQAKYWIETGSVYFTYPPPLIVPDPDAVNPQGFKQAADAWNRAIGNNFLTASTTSGDADIKVKVFQQGRKCGSSVACVSSDRSTFWIENNPLWEEEKNARAREWTDDFFQFFSNDKIFQYLPRTAAHEFGHTLGIRHSAARDTVMSGHGSVREVGDPCIHPTSVGRCGLAFDDIKGIQALYK